MKKFFKILFKTIGIIIAIVSALVAGYLIFTKIMNKKQALDDPDENYVSCSCLDEDFISETVA